MNRLELIAYTKTLMNEISPSNGLKIQIMNMADDKPLDNMIDQLLDQCACDVMTSAPLTLMPAKRLESVTVDSTKYVAHADKPDDWLRLLRASNRSWNVDVHKTTAMDSPCAARTGGLNRRGWKNHPVVMESERRLTLVPFWPDDTSDCEIWYVPMTKPEDLSLRLQWAVAWTCAARVMMIAGQHEAAEMAQNRAKLCL